MSEQDSAPTARPRKRPGCRAALRGVWGGVLGGAPGRRPARVAGDDELERLRLDGLDQLNRQDRLAYLDYLLTVRRSAHAMCGELGWCLVNGEYLCD